MSIILDLIKDYPRGGGYTWDVKKPSSGVTCDLIEMGPYAGKWYDPTYSVNDAGNLLRGKLNHATVEGNFGYNASKFTKNGGTGLTCTALY